jgi:ketosteroid isomerase-like protein
MWAGPRSEWHVTNSTEEPSRLKNAQRFLMHVGHQDTEEAVALLAPAVVYQVPGNNPLSGRFVGRDDVQRHLAELFRSTRGTYDLIQWEDWMVGGEHISVLAYVQMQRDGRVLDAHFVSVLRFDTDDRICEINFFPDDLRKVDRFFT